MGEYQVCILTFSLWFHISRQEDLQNEINVSGWWGYYLLISEKTDIFGTFEFYQSDRILAGKLEGTETQ